jgi:hypothetical protein
MFCKKEIKFDWCLYRLQPEDKISYSNLGKVLILTNASALILTGDRQNIELPVSQVTLLTQEEAVRIYEGLSWSRTMSLVRNMFGFQ